MVDFAFLDSGTGGIPYLLELKNKFPEANCVYVGDTANFPYGEKSHEQIVSCVSAVVSRIIEKFSPAVIVIACNTISVNALEDLRARFTGTQFVGTVPAIKLAAKVSKKKRIGLLATKATCENPYNIDLKNKFASDCEMILRPDADLISFIEHKSFGSSREEIFEACKPMADFFKAKDCDVVILGCTHFLNIKDEIAQSCGSGITVVDSCEGVVNHALEVNGGFRGAPLGEGVAEDSLLAEARGRNASLTSFVSDRQASENKTSLSPPVNSKLFVTGFSDKDDEKEYNVLCSRFGLEFNGLL